MIEVQKRGWGGDYIIFNIGCNVIINKENSMENIIVVLFSLVILVHARREQEV